MALDLLLTIPRTEKADCNFVGANSGAVSHASCASYVELREPGATANSCVRHLPGLGPSSPLEARLLAVWNEHQIAVECQSPSTLLWDPQAGKRRLLALLLLVVITWSIVSALTCITTWPADARTICCSASVYYDSCSAQILNVAERFFVE